MSLGRHTHSERARRYVAWLRRRAIAIIAAHVLLVAGGVYLIAYHLPLFADFSYLLPQDAPAVRDLRKLEDRVKATDVVIVVVEAQDPGERAAAVQELATQLRTIPSALVEEVATDDAQTRDFLEAHRYLLVPLAQLRRARDALAHRIQQAKLEANPLYIDLEDKDLAAEAKDKAQLDELRAQRREAQQKLDLLGFVSPDGRTALIQVRTAFRSTDAGLGNQLISAMSAARMKVVAAHPTVTIGFTGGVDHRGRRARRDLRGHADVEPDHGAARRAGARALLPQRDVAPAADHHARDRDR